MNIDSLIDQLRPISRTIEKLLLGEESYWVVIFPASADADYGFRACIYEDGEASISAVRVGADDGEYFWSVVFESADFDSTKDIGRHFIDTVSRLLNHDTRIIQSVGLINVGFDCAYYDKEGWHSVGGCAALRFSNFVFPKITGKEKEYRAGALRPA